VLVPGAEQLSEYTATADVITPHRPDIVPEIERIIFMRDFNWRTIPGREGRLYCGSTAFIDSGQSAGSRLNAMKRLLAVATALFAICVSASAQDWAKATLEKSPRHQEWVAVKHGNRVVHAFIVYPEIKNKAPAVLVIHEIYGLTDWVRSVADRLAA
jgi:hypothetical protein